MNNFLIESYNLELITFTKPKKQGDYYICKIKYPDSETGGVTIQFPKMTISSEPTSKKIELEFKNEIGYNKKIYNFLSTMDDYIIEKITDKSEEWFDKKIQT